MNKTLVAFYSRPGENYVNGNLKELKVGNTKLAAVAVEQMTYGDLFEIKQQQPYSYDYMTCIQQAKEDLNKNARPQLKELLANIDDYDTIYLAYPNYWGTMPMAVKTFLENYDFTGKTIKPLCTHEGSGLGHSEADIKELCPGADVQPGLAIQGGHVNKASSKIKAWVQA